MMINFLWLFLAVFAGFILSGLLSVNSTQDAYDEGKADAQNEIVYLKAKNSELTKQVEINRVIGGVK